MKKDKYYMKKFTKENTHKYWMIQQSRLLSIPQDELLDCLNSLQDKGLIKRVAKDKIKMINITV
ncbi:hypothetical protein [Priestia aryabhattai]|uniref:hypothetical protein n=1 Tax=Priestia aryabhattai TaxID=412384 RepID=UPI003D2BD5AC